MSTQFAPSEDGALVVGTSVKADFRFSLHIAIWVNSLHLLPYSRVYGAHRPTRRLLSLSYTCFGSVTQTRHLATGHRTLSSRQVRIDSFLFFVEPILNTPRLLVADHLEFNVLLRLCQILVKSWFLLVRLLFLDQQLILVFECYTHKFQFLWLRCIVLFLL